MHIREKLFSLLKEPSSPDYWSDHGSTIAIDFAVEMGPGDWQGVSADLKHLDREATIKFVDVLGERLQLPTQEELLLGFLVNTDEEIAETALSSINTLLQKDLVSEKGRNFIRTNLDRFSASGVVVQVLVSAVSKRLEEKQNDD